MPERKRFFFLQLTPSLNLLAKYEECKKQIEKIFFLLRYRLLKLHLLCRFQFPHCDFNLSRGLQKRLKSMKGTKLQYPRVMSLHLHLMSRLVAAVSVRARGEVKQNLSYRFP